MNFISGLADRVRYVPGSADEKDAIGSCGWIERRVRRRERRERDAAVGGKRAMRSLRPIVSEGIAGIDGIALRLRFEAGAARAPIERRSNADQTSQTRLISGATTRLLDRTTARAGPTVEGFDADA